MQKFEELTTMFFDDFIKVPKFSKKSYFAVTTGGGWAVNNVIN